MSEKSLNLGISPCPNDTFIFYHLLHKSKYAHDKLDLKIADVQELNQSCHDGTALISKVSFHLLGLLRDQYCLLPSGAALGYGCGPLLVSKAPIKAEELVDKTIAIPGKDTTAYLLLKCFCPEATQIKEMLFSDIMPAVLNGEVDAGLVIHESRFTYKSLGLELIRDLGEWWESETSLPIPLGGIIAKRELGIDLIKDFNQAIKDSVLWAKDNLDDPDFLKFIHQHAQEIEADVLKSHIKTYVNEESIELSEDAVKAVEKLFRIAEEKGIIPPCEKTLFID